MAEKTLIFIMLLCSNVSTTYSVLLRCINIVHYIMSTFVKAWVRVAVYFFEHFTRKIIILNWFREFMWIKSILFTESYQFNLHVVPFDVQFNYNAPQMYQHWISVLYLYHFWFKHLLLLLGHEPGGWPVPSEGNNCHSDFWQGIQP